jgi:hypothetical protein
MAIREPYAQMYPRFWDGPTGQELQRQGKDAVIVATFVMTTRYANMIGLYHLPVDYIAHTLHVLTRAEVLHGLDGVQRAGFALYDNSTEFVWVVEMARIRLNIQPGEQLSQRDKRWKRVKVLYDTLKQNPFLGPFYDRYALDLQLPERRDRRAQPRNGHEGSPLQAPSSPLQGAPISTGFQQGVTPETGGEAPYMPLVSPEATPCKPVTVPGSETEAVPESETEERRTTGAHKASAGTSLSDFEPDFDEPVDPDLELRRRELEKVRRSVFGRAS